MQASSYLNNIEVLKQYDWKTISNKVMTFTEVKSLFNDDMIIRISEREYESDVNFGSSAFSYFLFIKSGSCKITYSDKSISLTSEHFIKVPKGYCIIKILGKVKCECILVWLKDSVC